MVALHRSYLAEPGIKASIDPARTMLGPVAGAAVVLSDGAGPVVVGEGVETTLSLRDGLAHLDPRAWAALSAAGVAALELPKPASELVIAPDPDTAGRKAAETLARRAWSAGWRVKVLEPPAAGDWNDAARRTLAGFATLAAGYFGVRPVNPKQAYQAANEYVAEAPQPLLRETPPGKPYPIEALGPLREVAEALHDVTQAPLAIGAQSVLGVAALAGQALADVETLHGRAPRACF